MDFLMELLGKLQDPASLLPDLNQMLTDLVPVIRYTVLLAPGVLLVMGLVYLFLAPKEANHTLGFRCWWGMSSVEVWQFTQKLAGIIWIALGLVLGAIGLFTGMGYEAMSPDLMLIDALTAIMWQLLLVFMSIVAINLTLILLFDGRGRRRGSFKDALK